MGRQRRQHELVLGVAAGKRIRGEPRLDHRQCASSGRQPQSHVMANLAHDLEIKAVGLRSVDETPFDASWEREAENWVRWVRRPGHDSYRYYGASFFDEIVPSPGS